MQILNIIRRIKLQDWIRHLLLSFLVAAAVEYLLLPAAARSLEGISGVMQMSIIRMTAIAVIGSLALWAITRVRDIRVMERWAIVGVFAAMSVAALVSTFSFRFLALCALLLLALAVYALRGWNGMPEPVREPQKAHNTFLWITASISLCFFLFVSLWTAARYLTFNCPTFDMGVFSQMFHNMKTTGLPDTTIERDGLLSHFHVHVSPIYYLLLPFYWLFPSPITLQVLQAAVMTTAVIPLWKLGKHHGLTGLQRMLLCGVLLLAPAFSGGAAYDIHENCFLTPLILWLFYGIDRKNNWLTAIAALLTLCVKEDAAVYVAVIGLWLLVRSLLHHHRWNAITGGILLAVSLVWFFTVTGYLANYGDGVMTNRFYNFMYSADNSLLTVVKHMILSPMRTLRECIDGDKLKYIALTLLPLLGLPLMTRRYEHFILLIPYALINLAAAYKFQHDIFMQYSFGSLAFLMYMSIINLSEIRIDKKRTIALSAAAVIGAAGCCVTVLPEAIRFPKSYIQNTQYYESISDVLSVIPEDASVTASTAFTTYLSNRSVLYDMQRTTEEHLLSSEYVVLAPNYEPNYTNYGSYDEAAALLEANGYTMITALEGTLVIYHNPNNS